jgi:hypothetical protein
MPFLEDALIEHFLNKFGIKTCPTFSQTILTQIFNAKQSMNLIFRYFSINQIISHLPPSPIRGEGRIYRENKKSYENS